ncbi:MAG: DNA adenine methylase [Synechococcus sp. SB0665_bin_28]|nr:DNA adenine methylase [Cyanobacteria bacterium MAG IRC3_bin_20]MDE0648277.1 DNA adenine methylase [Cyanobacteria bacterium MAG IRC4_bin_6]MXY62733.1 DNA adenine methylase [Synechococcus sp. SB0665_bin_28]MYF20376.1 DNA adenine methylase [Synechococcus sp. SB0677_bin_5]
MQQLPLSLREPILTDEENTTDGVVPFNSQLLKWVGNKQRFACAIISFFPRRFRTYHEPFLGSGAVLGVLAPRCAEAADSFKPLIDIWQMLQSNPEVVKGWYRSRWLESQEGNRVEKYEQIKARYNGRANAADFLFLVRAAYGGVVRFRKADGYMSTPCGVHQPIHHSSFSRRVDAWSERIRGTRFCHREYEESLDRASEGDVVYCDPPYNHSQAILYGAQGFCPDAMFRKIEVAKRRGVFVALSLDGSKKSGGMNCNYDIPSGLFAREVVVNCGRSMLKRFQMGGQTLEQEIVTDRLLLTH